MKSSFFRGLEICQLKNEIESNFTTVEQAVLEFQVISTILISWTFKIVFLLYSPLKI